MFKTTLLRALRSADSVDVDGYKMDQLEWDDGIIKIVVDDENDIFFKDQEITIDTGSASVVPAMDPNGQASYGSLVEEIDWQPGNPIYLVFECKRTMREEDLLP